MKEMMEMVDNLFESNPQFDGDAERRGGIVTGNNRQVFLVMGNMINQGPVTIYRQPANEAEVDDLPEK